MKKTMIALLLCATLLLCCFQAFAEPNPDDYTYYPESEASVGTWYVDDYILEINHMDGAKTLFNCTVTRYDADGVTGERWSYDYCAYDDIGNALSCEQTGVKTNLTFDEYYEIANTETVYEDGVASFKLSDDGKMVWTDYKQDPGKEDMTFEKVQADDENPVAAFEGIWDAERASLTIEELDDVIYCNIQGSSSATESTAWSYECTYDETVGGLVASGNGVKTNIVFNENGDDESSEVEYKDGSATFVLNDEGKLVWTETSGDNELVFEKAVNED